MTEKNIKEVLQKWESQKGMYRKIVLNDKAIVRSIKALAEK